MTANWAPDTEAWRIVADVVVPAAYPQPVIGINFVHDLAVGGGWSLWVEIITPTGRRHAAHERIPGKFAESVEACALTIASRFSQWV
jgi:hypothetical protein